MNKSSGLYWSGSGLWSWNHTSLTKPKTTHGATGQNQSESFVTSTTLWDCLVLIIDNNVCFEHATRQKAASVGLPSALHCLTVWQTLLNLLRRKIWRKYCLTFAKVCKSKKWLLNNYVKCYSNFVLPRTYQPYVDGWDVGRPGQVFSSEGGCPGPSQWSWGSVHPAGCSGTVEDSLEPWRSGGQHKPLCFHQSELRSEIDQTRSCLKDGGWWWSPHFCRCLLSQELLVFLHHHHQPEDEQAINRGKIIDLFFWRHDWKRNPKKKSTIHLLTEIVNFNECYSPEIYCIFLFIFSPEWTFLFFSLSTLR